MSPRLKRIAAFGAVALVGFLSGRLAVRAALNALLGGTLFGGNFL